MPAIVLYQPEIAGNVGTIARTCAVLGFGLHLVRPLGFRLGDPTLKRAAMDYLEGVDVQVHDSWRVFIEQLPQSKKLWTTGATGRNIYSQQQFEQNDFFVFGSESNGLPKELLQQHSSLRIPMPQGGRSLNLAVSVGVVAFEAAKQLSKNWQNV